MRILGLLFLIFLLSVSCAQADTITINGFNSTLFATIGYDNGAGNIGSGSFRMAQINATYTGSAGVIAFNTFCIDLFHAVSALQTYDVVARPDLATGFSNYHQMAYVFQQFGLPDLSGDSKQAAAVQLALWDLSLNNHSPSTFSADLDGTYNSGDKTVFSVDFGGNPNAAQIAALTNQYLHDAQGAANQGGWFDGDAGLNRGQSLLLPPALQSRIFAASEPPSLLLLALGLVCLSSYGFRGRF